MTETFLILFAGGIMLAAAIANPRQVTLLWLRLAGILALCMAALAYFFLYRRDASAQPGQQVLTCAIAIFVLGQLAFVQVARRTLQRFFALAAAISAITLAAIILPATSRAPAPTATILAFRILSMLGIAAVTGIALMDMLLGHAYLTASQMTMKPFLRLNRALAAALVFRALCAVALALIFNSRHPLYMFWGIYGLYIGTRWLVGLAIPAAFVYMAHDCIRRRATQSATGILYVAGVLVFIGEITGLYLLQQTGLPF
jgi:hypothetical protein